ncbi:MAG: DUF3568 family protein [Lentisphaerae bacterium]|nr:DUF3568 family protein [Lentisphaerota bacterium]
MKQSRQWITALAAVAISALVGGGCAMFVVGAAAGAGAGTVSYCGNELRVSRAVSLDRAWEAANAAMKEMTFPIIPLGTNKDGTGGFIQGRNAGDQKVRIRLIRQSDQVTEIRVRVGTFSTAENRNAAQLLYDTISKHLTP